MFCLQGLEVAGSQVLLGVGGRGRAAVCMVGRCRTGHCTVVCAILRLHTLAPFMFLDQKHRPVVALVETIATAAWHLAMAHPAFRLNITLY